MAYTGKNPKFNSVVLTDLVATTPTNPKAGSSTLINRNGNALLRDSAGNEKELLTAGSVSGGINLVTNSDASNDLTGWVDSGTGTTVSRTTTAAEIALSPLKTTAIKISNDGSSTGYTRYRFTLPTALKNVVNGISWDQVVGSTYASGDFKVELYYNAASDYSGGYTLINLFSEDDIPAASGTYENYFLTSQDYLELRVTRVAGGSAGTDWVSIGNVNVGPGTTVSGANIGPWLSFTPTGSWVANTTYNGFYRRVGETLEVHATWQLTGAPTSATLTINLPTGLTIDTGKLSKAGTLNAGDTLDTSDGRLFDSGTGEYNAKAVYNNTTSVLVRYWGSSAVPTNVTQAQPFTWANNDYGQISFSVPIAEWATGSTIYQGQNNVEYAYNTSLTDATDTTSFGYGPLGSTFNYTFTANRTKRVRFQTAIQDTDRVIPEIQIGGTGPWFEYAPGNEFLAPFSISTWSGTAGMYIGPVSGSSTDIDVFFGRYRTATTDWSTNYSTYRWRLKKTRAGVPVGFGLVTSTAAGLIAPPNQLTDAAATMLGLKVYAHGTSYNGGNSPTITLFSGGGTLSSVTFSYFIPYQMQDGGWRMRFNYAVLLSSAARTSATLAVAGIDILGTQAISANSGASAGVLNSMTANTTTTRMTVSHASATTTDYYLSGDIALNAKPTWAY